MIQHVYERAEAVPGVDQVLVATDDARIAKAVEKFGGRAVMTRSDHLSGSDRLAEAAKKINAPEDDIIVNVQGDQPAFDPRPVADIIDALLSDPKCPMATAATPLNDPDRIKDPNAVKVVFGRDLNALYFSRAPIPHPRDGEGAYYLHIGIYGYRMRFLQQFVALPQGRLEKLERLEQLRALEHGFSIKVVMAVNPAPDVDLPSDIIKVEKYLLKKGG